MTTGDESLKSNEIFEFIMFNKTNKIFAKKIQNLGLRYGKSLKNMLFKALNNAIPTRVVDYCCVSFKVKKGAQI